MTIYIKNMVCNRCIAAVEHLLPTLGFPATVVGMGWAHLEREDLAETEKQTIQTALVQLGFEWIDDRRQRLIEGIKLEIIQRIQAANFQLQSIVWSTWIAEALHYDYKYLSGLFSSVEGITIEQFIILQKVEKAKELIIYDELSLAEIADRLGYSSVAHLGNQFRKVTGMPPGKFRTTGLRERKALDKLNRL